MLSTSSPDKSIVAAGMFKIQMDQTLLKIPL